MFRKVVRAQPQVATRLARGLPGVALLVGVMLTGLPVAQSAASNPPPRERIPHRIATGGCGASWVGAWQSSPVQFNSGDIVPWDFNHRHPVPVIDAVGPIATLTGRTLRMVVPPVASGSQLRLRFSNRFGNAPLHIGSVVVARFAGGAEVVGGSARHVSFSGAPDVTIAQGDDVVSDAVTYSVKAHSPLSVSVYVIDAPRSVTRHLDNRRTSYISEPGDYTDDGPAVGFTTLTFSTFHLTGLDVYASKATAAVVAFGDSITDGTGGSHDLDRRYTDVLQRRLEDAGGDRRMAVLNAGIGANRLLTDEQFGMGESALTRLPLEALRERGTVDVILHEGTNDPALQWPRRSSGDLINGMKRFAATAHKLDLRAFATTITPTTFPMHAQPRAVRMRDAVNRWIRTDGGKYFDGVFDFAAAVADPQDAHQLAAPFDAGDHLHLSDVGQARLADAVDLNQLSGSPCLHARRGA